MRAAKRVRVAQTLPPALDGALFLETQGPVPAAAQRGLGLALGRRPLLDGRLKSGALLAPLDTPNPSVAGYQLCQPVAAAPTALARRVAGWLREPARAQVPAAADT